MQLTPRAQAVLLLNVSFGKSDTGQSKPLSKREWARFALWLNENGLEPSALLKGDLDELLEDWEDRRITPERLRVLLNRGAALGLSLERWQRAGLWVLTRSDADYPERLRRRLGAAAPAVIFGCGNRSLLGRGGIAVVGSRNAGEDDLASARNLGAEAARQGYSVVSGGARGVDRDAMQGALEREGTAVGVLADSLLRSAMSAAYRQYILSGDLALVSPFNPEARFNVGNAMARNACIYCLADAAVVVSSEAGKGGTWSGAVEDLEHEWVPLWVKPGSAAASGNPELVGRGANWLPSDAGPLWRLIGGTPPAEDGQDLLPPDLTAPPLLREEPEPYAPSPAGKPPQPANDALYALFLARMAELTAEKPVGVQRIAETLRLKRPQAEDWLKRAVSEGQVVSEGRQGQYSVSPGAARSPADGDFYALFLACVTNCIAAVAPKPKRQKDIAAELQLKESQAAEWLKRAADEGRMIRQESPVRYRTAEASLFGDRA